MTGIVEDTDLTRWAIDTRELHKVYPSQAGPVDALRGIDLEIGPGEFIAVMGPSGCGKSTLLHLLGGLDLPTSGEVWVDGRRIDKLGESARAGLRRAAVGFVFQSFNLIPDLTVGGNIDLPGALARRPRSQVVARRNELLDGLGLSGKAGRAPAELSGGEQQRVALARALINDPAVVLADEPTGNLDTKAGSAVLEVIGECHRRGQAIVLATHDHRIAAAAQRVIAMRDGRIVDEALMTGRTPAKAEDTRRLVRLGNES
jgi:putative ABC transport system ATP-binding protein